MDNRIVAHIAKVINSLKAVSLEAVEQVVEAILLAHHNNVPILICGNGGSAATAMHFAGDLRSIGILAWDLLAPVKVTQIGNDSSYGAIFSEQAQKGLVVAFSCSGTSQNVISVSPAILFTSTWSKMPLIWGQSRLTVVVESDDKDYETIEDVHLVLCHAIKNELKARLV